MVDTLLLDVFARHRRGDFEYGISTRVPLLLLFRIFVAICSKSISIGVVGLAKCILMVIIQTQVENDVGLVIIALDLSGALRFYEVLFRDLLPPKNGSS